MGAPRSTVTAPCGPEAPAPVLRVSGAPNATSEMTPAAMRAATLSVRRAPGEVPTWPLRTCSTTARASCVQHTPHATQATRAKADRRRRASGPHS